jgi:hypothetical protein
VRDLNSADILLGAVDDGSNIVRDYLVRDHFQIDIEPDKNSSAHIQISEGWIELGPEDLNDAFQD